MTSDNVVKMNRYQVEGRFHPMTCPNRNDGQHRVWNGDLGALVATVRLWECPFCNYRQPTAPAEKLIDIF